MQFKEKFQTLSSSCTNVALHNAPQIKFHSRPLSCIAMKTRFQLPNVLVTHLWIVLQLNLQARLCGKLHTNKYAFTLFLQKNLNFPQVTKSVIFAWDYCKVSYSLTWFLPFCFEFSTAGVEDAERPFSKSWITT